MTQEEKARAYDEALERAKEQLRDAVVFDYKEEQIAHDIRQTCYSIFPILKESEDERIRKELIEHCKNQAKPYIDTGNECPQIQSWIAWLEKQGELPHWKKSILPNNNVTGFNSDYFTHNGYYINYKELFNKLPKDNFDLKKQGVQSIQNVPSRETILAIWDLGNEWKELTHGSISTEHGSQLGYIQNHWEESEYYLREKQGEIDNIPLESSVNNVTTDSKKWKFAEMEIPFGAKDSELIEETIYIPEGFHAEIKGNKVVIKKNE